jgi:hypothetical protein
MRFSILTKNGVEAQIQATVSPGPPRVFPGEELGMRCAHKSTLVLLILVFLILVRINGALAQTITSSPANKIEPSRITPSARAEKWVPDDIDYAVPAVSADAACSLPEVLARAGQRVQELVENVDRFTATEVLSHQSVDGLGRKGRPTTLKFDYLVSISAVRDGFFSVEEFRNRSRSLDMFPSHIATVGTPSLILIFHPRYIGDFKTTCEGLGNWKGHPAWQIRFEQRPDRPNRTSVFVVDGKAYNGDLRGRAWILADSYQVTRLDTDQERPIPKIRLRRSHESIEYGPVAFPNNKLQLWLPSSAELYMDFRGQRFYRKHSFTDFKLFSVDTQYEVKEPKETQAP